MLLLLNQKGQQKTMSSAQTKQQKLARLAAEEIIAQGKEPISQAEYDLSSSLSASVHAHPTASKLLSFGQPELKLFYSTDPSIWS